MTLDKLYTIIYQFYPRNCQYESNEYNKKIEYIRYKNILNNNKDYFTIQKSIKKVFIDYYVKMWDDKNEPGVHYSILLHKNQEILDDDIDLINILGGRRIDLEVYISKLTKVCYSYVIETLLENNEWHFNIYQTDSVLEYDIIKNMNECMSKFGYYKLSRDIVNKIVPDIETEFHYLGEVKVFHCLFSDIVDEI